MSNRRSILQILAGILIGIAVTATVFWVFTQKTSPDNDPIKPNPTIVKSTPPAIIKKPGPEDMESFMPQMTQRDLRGDCTIQGSISLPAGTTANTAIVGLRLLDEPWPSANLPQTQTTDIQGQFKFNGLSPKAVYQLWAFSEGSSVVSHEKVTCGEPIHLALENGGSITFSFFDEKHTPIGPVNVHVASTSFWPARKARSDANGILSVKGLEEGLISIWAIYENNVFLSPKPIEINNGVHLNKNITLSKASFIDLQIVDENNNPIKNAAISVTPQTAPLLSKVYHANDTGRCTVFFINTGEFIVQASADGYPLSPEKLVSFATDTTIRLTPGAEIHGRVILQDGSPLKDSTLFLGNVLGQKTTTKQVDERQSFQTAIAHSKKQGSPFAPIVNDASVIIGPKTIPLPIQESNGAPTISSSDLSALKNTFKTSDQGSFVLTGLPSGQTFINVTHKNYVQSKKTNITLAPAQILKNVTIVMQEGIDVSVRVLGEDTFPVNNANVSFLDSNNSILARATTNADGVVNYLGMPNIFRLEITADDYVPIVTSLNAHPSQPVDVVLKMPFAQETLSGHVVNKHGLGIPNVTVVARANRKIYPHVLTTRSNSDGTFKFEGVGKNTYSVSAKINNATVARVPNAKYNQIVAMVADTTQPAVFRPNEITTDNLTFRPTGNKNASTSTSAVTINTRNDLRVPNIQSDNLGVVSNTQNKTNSSAAQEHTAGTSIQVGQSIETPFGMADTLTVTGPPPGRGSLPIVIGGSPGSIIVKSVQKGSAVYDAGLRKGHKIIGIDGAKMHSPAQARKALFGAINSVILLQVSAPSGKFNIAIQRVRVIK